MRLRVVMGRVSSEAEEQLVVTCMYAGGCLESPGVVWGVKGLLDCYTHSDHYHSLCTPYCNIRT